MECFYKGLASGLSTTEALHETKIYFLGRDERAGKTLPALKAACGHPFYWAPFTVLGVDAVKLQQSRME